jgi:alpha-L-fucosidase
MWPSSNSFNWNSMDVGPKLDLLGELFSAVRRNSDLKIGVYYSLFEFFNDLYLRDKESNFTKNDYIEVKKEREFISVLIRV